MSILNNVRLVIKYPFLLPRNVWTGKLNYWDKAWKAIKAGKFSEVGYWIYHFDHTKLDWMPDGWRKVFGEQMCEEIKQELIRCSKIMNVNKSILLNSYNITDIKEKYGTLRWYDTGEPIMGKINEIVDKYERLSMCYCINCGKPVRYRTKGWIEYLCEDCAKKTIKSEYLDECRLTEKDIPRYYTYDSDGNREADYKVILDPNVDFKKLWGLEDKENE